MFRMKINFLPQPYLILAPQRQSLSLFCFIQHYIFQLVPLPPTPTIFPPLFSILFHNFLKNNFWLLLNICCKYHLQLSQQRTMIKSLSCSRHSQNSLKLKYNFFFKVALFFVCYHISSSNYSTISIFLFGEISPRALLFFPTQYGYIFQSSYMALF